MEGDLEPYGSYNALANENRKLGSTIEQLRNQLRREYNTSNRLRRLRNQYRLTAEELSYQVTQLLNESKEQWETGSSDDENTRVSSAKRIEEEPQVNGSVATSQGHNKYYSDVPDFHGITKNGTPGDFIRGRNLELVGCYFRQNRLEFITYVTSTSLLLLISLRLAV